MIRAGHRLHQLDCCEELAQSWEQAVGLLQTVYARHYRILVGVDPAQRCQLRSALEHIQAGGGGIVAEVLAQLNRIN